MVTLRRVEDADDYGDDDDGSMGFTRTWQGPVLGGRKMMMRMMRKIMKHGAENGTQAYDGGAALASPLKAWTCSLARQLEMPHP